MFFKKKVESKYDKLAITNKIHDMVIGKGWQEVLEPWLTAAITTCVGGKVNKNGIEKWVGGRIQDSASCYDDNIKYELGRKQALIDVYNFVMNHEITREQLMSAIKKEEERLKNKSPYAGSRYNG